MDLELVFKLVNYSVLPAWLMLILMPRAAITTRVVQTAFIPLFFALVYLYFIAWGMFFSVESGDGNFSSLKGVMAIFDSPISTLAGWAHYLVFDLFVGMWIVRDSQRHAIAHLWIVPCLILTLLFGPLGLGFYLILRLSLSKSGIALDESMSKNS